MCDSKMCMGVPETSLQCPYNYVEKIVISFFVGNNK